MAALLTAAAITAASATALGDEGTSTQDPGCQIPDGIAGWGLAGDALGLLLSLGWLPVLVRLMLVHLLISALLFVERCVCLVLLAGCIPRVKLPSAASMRQGSQARTECHCVGCTANHRWPGP